MSEEIEKEVETTTDAPAQEDKGNTSKEEAVDYKAELEKAKKDLADKDERIKQAEFTIVKLKKTPEEDGQGENDPEEIARTVTDKVRQDMVIDTLEEEISKRAESPEHAELLKMYYDKRIQKSGFSRKAIADDLDAAALLVNKPKIDAALKEMKQKAISNGTKSNGGAVSGYAEEGKDEVSYSAADRTIMQRFGIKEEDISK
jgi:hypothetical protein